MSSLPTKHLLTTVDNPYDPFTEFREWYSFDEAAGYHTSALLARIVITSDELSDVEQEMAVEHAIDEIVKENVTGMFRKVTR